MEEATTWLVHGGALAFELATDSYFLLSRTFVTFSSTLLSFMRAHVVSLAWGLVVGAAVIDWGRTFDTRLFFLEDPTTLFTTTFVRFCDESHVLSRFGDAGYVLGYPF